MASKEIIERIKRQLNDGYIDLNDDYDNEEMNYIRKAIYDLELYKKAIHIAVRNCEARDYKEKFMRDVCQKQNDDYCESIECVKCVINNSLEQARKELENGK